MKRLLSYKTDKFYAEILCGHYWEKRYKQINLLPSIMVNRGSFGHDDEENTEHHESFRLVADFLIFYIELSLEW